MFILFRYLCPPGGGGVNGFMVTVALWEISCFHMGFDNAAGKVSRLRCQRRDVQGVYVSYYLLKASLREFWD